MTSLKSGRVRLVRVLLVLLRPTLSTTLLRSSRSFEVFFKDLSIFGTVCFTELPRLIVSVNLNVSSERRCTVSTFCGPNRAVPWFY